MVGILDLRDEQLDMLNTRMNGQDASFDDIRSSGSVKDNEMQPVTSSNLSLLDKQHTERLHEHDDGCPCGCSNFPHSMHERPVSIAGSVYDTATGQASVPGSINLSDNDDNESLLSDNDLLLIYSLNNRALLNANISNLTKTGHVIGVKLPQHQVLLLLQRLLHKCKKIDLYHSNSNWSIKNKTKNKCLHR